MEDQVKIAGKNTVADWKTAKARLIAAPENTALWEAAFNDFLSTRIQSRYFAAIEAIGSIAATEGKGFSIVAIYCSLIEFFEMLIKGYDFTHPRYFDRGRQPIYSLTRTGDGGNTRYLSNKEIFIHFLTENSPFAQQFTIELAGSFYTDVRCALLHQAETKGVWLIKNGAVKGDLICRSSNQMNELSWKSLGGCFERFLHDGYKRRLCKESEIQQNFIFTFDRICGLI